MEAAVSNLFSPGDKVLVINGGKFGERWLNIANAFALDPIEVKVEWGQAVKVDAVEKQLKLHPDIQSVMLQASETSTTVLHPVKEIANLTKNGPLFLVDGVTAVGVLPVPLDKWGIDALVTGSQKAHAASRSGLHRPQRALGRRPRKHAPLLFRPQSRTQESGKRLRRFYAGGLIDFRSTRVAQHDGAGRFPIASTPDMPAWRGQRARGGNRHGLKLLAPDSPSPAATGIFYRMV